MTELKRWSDPASEVNPVLRSVLRYAREVGPEPQQLQHLLRAAAPVRRLAPRPPLRFLAAAALAAAFGGVAWAGYSGRFFTAPAAPLPSTAPVTVPSVAAKPAAVAVTSLEPAPSSVPSGTAPRSLLPRSSNAAPTAAAFEPSPLLETTLLQQARGSVVSDPGRALTLTRDHELHFPGSALTEERQALRIEALARLGRKAEAAAAFEGFQARYPRSLYARKLAVLLGG